MALAAATTAAQAGRWALAISLGFLVVGIPILAGVLRGAASVLSRRGAGAQQPALWWGRSLVVGEDNRVSTSKTIAVIWTYSVAAALLSFIVARWLGHPGGFNALTKQGLNAQYAILIGGPLGAAILAKGIVSSQVASGAAAKPPADGPAPGQLVQNDSGQADLGDVQYVLFNVIALIFFYGEIFRAPQLGMPTIPDVLIGLTSVSAVGFVGKKALAGPAGISSVDPPAAHVGDPVQIATAGLIQAGHDMTGITVKFGKAGASPGTLSTVTTTSFGVLITAVVPPGAAGTVDVTVSVPNAKPILWPGFKVLPRIVRAQNLVVRRGERFVVQTVGVTGLAHSGDLAVRIGGAPALSAMNGTGELEVSVPEGAPTGETTLEVATPGGIDHAPITVNARSGVADGAGSVLVASAHTNGGNESV